MPDPYPILRAELVGKLWWLVNIMNVVVDGPSTDEGLSLIYTWQILFSSSG